MRIEQKLAIPIIFVTLGNLVNGLYRSKDLFYFLAYVGVFIIPIIFMVFTKITTDKMISKFLLIMSCFAVWLNDYADLTSVIFFCFSIFIVKQDKKSLYIYAGITVFFVMLKFTFHGVNMSQIIAFISGSSFIFILYFHYIHPKKEENFKIKKDYYKLDLPRDVIDIIELRVLGYDWHEINDKLELNITDERVRRRVAESVKRLGFSNKEEFIFNLTEKGIIMSFSDKTKF